MAIRARAEDDHAALSVADTRIGLTPAAIPAIVEPLRQAETGTDRRFDGAGLELTIVWQLVGRQA